MIFLLTKIQIWYLCCGLLVQGKMVICWYKNGLELTQRPQARSFGVMTHSEEMKVRDLVTRTTEVLQRASAGPDDIGSRYARLLELLWKPKQPTAIMASSPASTTNRSINNNNNNPNSNELRIAKPTVALNRVPEPGYVQFSPTNDFSWLDLEAVGDYVSGDQMPGPGILGLLSDDFSTPELYPSAAGQERGMPAWQVPAWMGDLSGNLLF